MCGRFVVARATGSLVAFYSVDQPADDLPEPNYNIRPTDSVPIVVDTAARSQEPANDSDDGAATGVRRLEAARWSLVPPFAKELKLPYPTFNARSESAASKPSFRASVATKRCIVPADGYYEWLTAADNSKTPFYITDADEDVPLSFAGLYSWWADPTFAADDPDRWVLSATILTMAAPPELAHIHDRTPVTLPTTMIDDWLDPGTRGDQGLMDAAVEASLPVARSLHTRQVAPLRGNGPELIRSVR
ncbi:SOS response-associated peptidase [Lysinibacter cavernae]|uniref:Abasic site processing protein n=1 Tax=Lysinibacter cavernae TaxID=1640652 RepID=A0A7X5R3K7_9MICO|nr:SOS response-associated peptidase [Lysinibacter cavernae]NIH55009.1 putative SOS response-associated peptidase YedK [Lysinibacter cavernae]